MALKLRYVIFKKEKLKRIDKDVCLNYRISFHHVNEWPILTPLATRVASVSPKEQEDIWSLEEGELESLSDLPDKATNSSVISWLPFLCETVKWSNT